MSTFPRLADVVIIGAGVMGMSIAFRLATRKAGSVGIASRWEGENCRRHLLPAKPFREGKPIKAQYEYQHD